MVNMNVFNKKSPHIFLHLHKCGGTSLMQCLDVNYQSDRVYAIDGSAYRESYKNFIQLSEKERKRVTLLRGHHFFGSHRYLQNGAKYFTMLRDPYSRLASLYNFLREIDLYKEINQNDMTLGTFLDSGLAMAADNGMTRMLTNNDFDSIANGEINEDLSDEAIANIKNHFAAVGIMEEFKQSLQMFKKLLGWKHLPSYLVKNKTKISRVDREFVIDFIDANPSYYRYLHADLKLYDFAAKLFYEQS